MTRYARGKGSKASNEKLPNEPTPWHVMKQQVEEYKNKEPLVKKKGAKELLKEQESMLDNNTDGNTWAEFEDNNSKFNEKKKLKSLKTNRNVDTNLTKISQNNDIVTPESNNNIKKLQKPEDTTTNATDNKKNTISNKKEQPIKEESSLIEEKSSIPQNEVYLNPNMLSKRQKRNLKRKLNMSDNESKKFKQDISSQNAFNKKERKIKTKTEYKRRKPDVGVTKMTINGVETEIVKFDGFPVKKEDGIRLAELKQKLIMKGKYTFI